MTNQENPLVSVRILTYNSSKYVINTLDSIFNQTYQNIELIISDDCSTDDTIEICREWLDKHEYRFSNVVFMTSPVNTGVCANSKRSLEAANGEWIKGLGGDDALYKNAISDLVNFVQAEKCNICASLMDYMDEDGNPLITDLGGRYNDYQDILCLPYRKQYRLAKQSIIVPGPVLFYSKKVYQITGGPNDKYGAADEWSFLYKVLKNGFRIHLCKKILVKYRVRESSLCHSSITSDNSYHRLCNRQFIKEVILPDMIKEKNYLLWWHIYIKYIKYGNKRYKYLSILDPLWYVDKIKLLIGKM